MLSASCGRNVVVEGGIVKGSVTVTVITATAPDDSDVAAESEEPVLLDVEVEADGAG